MKLELEGAIRTGLTADRWTAEGVTGLEHTVDSQALK